MPGEGHISTLHALPRMQAGDIGLAILGNKVDLPPREQSVPDAEARAFADSIGASHFAFSAKTGLVI